MDIMFSEKYIINCDGIGFINNYNKNKAEKKDKKVDEKKVFLVKIVDSKQNIHDILSM